MNLVALQEQRRRRLVVASALRLSAGAGTGTKSDGTASASGPLPAPPSGLAPRVASGTEAGLATKAQVAKDLNWASFIAMARRSRDIGGWRRARRAIASLHAQTSPAADAVCDLQAAPQSDLSGCQPSQFWGPSTAVPSGPAPWPLVQPLLPLPLDPIAEAAACEARAGLQERMRDIYDTFQRPLSKATALQSMLNEIEQLQSWGREHQPSTLPPWSAPEAPPLQVDAPPYVRQTAVKVAAAIRHWGCVLYDAQQQREALLQRRRWCHAAAAAQADGPAPVCFSGHQMLTMAAMKACKNAYMGVSKTAPVAQMLAAEMHEHLPNLPGPRPGSGSGSGLLSRYPPSWRRLAEEDCLQVLAAAVAGAVALRLTAQREGGCAQPQHQCKSLANVRRTYASYYDLDELEPLTCAALYAVLVLVTDAFEPPSLVNAGDLYDILSYLEPAAGPSSVGLGFRLPVARFSMEHLEWVAVCYSSELQAVSVVQAAAARGMARAEGGEAPPQICSRWEVELEKTASAATAVDGPLARVAATPAAAAAPVAAAMADARGHATGAGWDWGPMAGKMRLRANGGEEEQEEQVAGLGGGRGLEGGYGSWAELAQGVGQRQLSYLRDEVLWPHRAAGADPYTSAPAAVSPASRGSGSAGSWIGASAKAAHVALSRLELLQVLDLNLDPEGAGTERNQHRDRRRDDLRRQAQLLERLASRARKSVSKGLHNGGDVSGGSSSSGESACGDAGATVRCLWMELDDKDDEDDEGEADGGGAGGSGHLLPVALLTDEMQQRAERVRSREADLREGFARAAAADGRLGRLAAGILAPPGGGGGGTGGGSGGGGSPATIPAGRLAAELAWLRPGLVAAHEDSWGRLLRLAAEEEDEEEEELLEGGSCACASKCLRHALLGLLLLAHRPDLPPQVLRLVPCVAAGVTYEVLAPHGGSSWQQQQQPAAGFPCPSAHYRALTTFAAFSFLPAPRLGDTAPIAAAGSTPYRALTRAQQPQDATARRVAAERGWSAVSEHYEQDPVLWGAVAECLSVRALSAMGVAEPWLVQAVTAAEGGDGAADGGEERSNFDALLLELRRDVVVEAAAATLRESLVDFGFGDDEDDVRLGSGDIEMLLYGVRQSVSPGGSSDGGAATVNYWCRSDDNDDGSGDDGGAVGDGGVGSTGGSGDGEGWLGFTEQQQWQRRQQRQLHSETCDEQRRRRQLRYEQGVLAAGYDRQPPSSSWFSEFGSGMQASKVLQRQRLEELQQQEQQEDLEAWMRPMDQEAEQKQERNRRRLNEIFRHMDVQSPEADAAAAMGSDWALPPPPPLLGRLGSGQAGQQPVRAPPLPEAHRGGGGGAGAGGGGRRGAGLSQQLGGPLADQRRAVPLLLEVWRCAVGSRGLSQPSSYGDAPQHTKHVVAVGGPALALTLTAMLLGDCSYFDRQHAGSPSPPKGGGVARRETQRQQQGFEPCLHACFQPSASARTAQLALGLGSGAGGQPSDVFPPPPELPGVTLLAVRGPSVPYTVNARLAERPGELLVSKRKGYTVAAELARHALVSKRLGSLRVQAMGLEELETAVLVLAQIRGELLAEDRDLTVVVTSIEHFGIAAAADEESETTQENDENDSSGGNNANQNNGNSSKSTGNGNGTGGDRIASDNKPCGVVALFEQYDACVAAMRGGLPALNELLGQGEDGTADEEDEDEQEEGEVCSAKSELAQTARCRVRQLRHAVPLATQLMVRHPAVACGVHVTLLVLECEKGRPDRLVLQARSGTGVGEGAGARVTATRPAVAAAGPSAGGGGPKRKQQKRAAAAAATFEAELRAVKSGQATQVAGLLKRLEQSRLKWAMMST